MFHLLEKIRTQSSRAQRAFIAFSISLLFTGLIFVMWLIKEKEIKVISETTKKVNAYTPTDTLLKNIQDMWGSVSGAIADTQNKLQQVDFSSTIEYTQ